MDRRRDEGIRPGGIEGTSRGKDERVSDIERWSDRARSNFQIYLSPRILNQIRKK
jgi:hypothetical protein